MELQQFISPCHFGMEAILKREIYDLGYDIVKVEDGRVTYEGDMETIFRANIHLRTTERVLLKVGEFHAETFDELFEAVKAIPWENYLPVDAKFSNSTSSPEKNFKDEIISCSRFYSLNKLLILLCCPEIQASAVRVSHPLYLLAWIRMQIVNS